MKRTIGAFCFFVVCGLAAFSQGLPSTGTPAGIVKVAELPKTNVFEIKVKGTLTLDQARLLDSNMLSKQGIISSVTTPATRICRVEVLKAISESNLQQVVSHSGLEVSKSFTE